MREINRRTFATLAGATLLAPRALAQSPEILTRTIPSTGERLATVGLGTAQVFDTGDETTKQKAGAVLQALIAGGGRLVDTSSVYGEAEVVIGEVVGRAHSREKLFLATKLEAPDLAELKRSLARLQTDKLDLLQFHNVRNPEQSLAQFKEWKAQGICRYIGITSTRHADFAAIEAVLAREKPDFVQIDYSLDDREAEKRILPVAAEVKTAVLTALPFGRARLFRAVRGKETSGLGARICRELGAILSQIFAGGPRVTAVIPGTADAGHMTDNLGAMRGPLPNEEQRRQMVAFADAL